MVKLIYIFLFIILSVTQIDAITSTANRIKGSSASGIVYRSGDAHIEGSIRFNTDSTTGITIVEKLIDGVWQPHSFMTSPETVWLGKRVGVSAGGHHLLTEDADGQFHFHAHSQFDGETTQSDTAVVYVYNYVERYIAQPDDSGSWTGKEFSYIAPAPFSVLMSAGYFKTHDVAATKTIHVQVWEGTDDTGTLILDQSHPASKFSANTEIIVHYTGYLEFDAGGYYFIRYSSDADFSLKTDSTNTYLWSAADLSFIRTDNLLQTAPWVDGGTYDEEQYFIKDRKIYVCNITGVQTGTFEDNSDKWRLLEQEYIVGKFTETAVPFANSEGRLIEDPTNLFYDPYGYLHTPGLAIYEDGSILKNGHGLSLLRNTEDVFDIVHLNTQTKSAYFKYDPVSDSFLFDKNVETEKEFKAQGIDFVYDNQVIGKIKATDTSTIAFTGPNGQVTYWAMDIGAGLYCYEDFFLEESLYVNNNEVVSNTGLILDSALPKSDNWDEAYSWGDHPVETDPVYSAWDKSTGISITESQISDLDHFATGDETDPIYTAWNKSTGISITESQISDLDHFVNGDETDPIYTAWNKSTGISITESQISDLSHTPEFDGDIAEIYNSLGDFKIQPDVQGNVILFGDTDVANDESGKMLYIRRQAPEDNNYMRFYISASEKGYIHTSCPMTLQAQVDFTINSVTEDIFFKVGDNAGAKKFYFRDSDNISLLTIDSNGLFLLDANMGGVLKVVRGSNNSIETFMDSTYTDLKFGGSKEYNRIGTWIDKPFQIVTNSLNRIIIDQYGRVEIPNSLTVNDITVNDDILAYGDISARNHEVRRALVFDDKSTQIEAGERHFSQGHTHTAVYNNDWYDASSENISERDIHFSPDGLMMYVIGLANNGVGDCSIWEYQLTIPWDLSTVGTPTVENIETYGSNQVGLFISIDGRRLWTVCTSNDTVIEYSMTPWNISNLSWVQAKDISSQDSSPSAVFWSANGDRLFIAGDSDNDIVAFSITNEWDIGGISWFEDFGTDIDAPTGLHFSSDGRRMYVMDGSAEDDIHEFHLSDPWMIGSARLANLFDVSDENTSPQGIFIAPDNSKIFMVGTGTPDGVYGYDLGLEINGAIIANGDFNHNGSNIGFYGVSQTNQPAHIIDADGTLADITAKFNSLLLNLESLGLQASP